MLIYWLLVPGVLQRNVALDNSMALPLRNCHQTTSHQNSHLYLTYTTLWSSLSCYVSLDILVSGKCNHSYRHIHHFLHYKMSFIWGFSNKYPHRCVCIFYVYILTKRVMDVSMSVSSNIFPHECVYICILFDRGSLIYAYKYICSIISI